MVELLRMETSHNAKSDHVRIDHKLLHHLALRLSLLLLDLELSVLSDTLNDGHSDTGILLNVILSELFKGILNVFDVGAIVVALITGESCRCRLLHALIGFIVRRVPAILTIECKDIVQLFLLSRLLETLTLEHFEEAFFESSFDLVLELQRFDPLPDRIFVVEFLVASWHAQVKESCRCHPLDLPRDHRRFLFQRCRTFVALRCCILG